VVIEAVVFDLDGVLLDSEHLWDRARRDVVAEHGGQWRAGATEAMQGMSSLEWAPYLREHLGLELADGEIVDLVVDKLLDGYHRELPLLPGAVGAVERLGTRWPLALASSANRVVIDEVLLMAGLQDAFAVTVSSEEVARGKPAPDVYLEAARRLGHSNHRCAAIEDSGSGIRAALAAGLLVVAVPNREYPPADDLLADVALVVGDLDHLSVEALDVLGLDDGTDEARERRLDEAEIESFPASDPHSDWAGP
jgi:HAD superfamily hydrolase (TIGR01509 family)